MGAEVGGDGAAAEGDVGTAGGGDDAVDGVGGRGDGECDAGDVERGAGEWDGGAAGADRSMRALPRGRLLSGPPSSDAGADRDGSRERAGNGGVIAARGSPVSPTSAAGAGGDGGRNKEGTACSARKATVIATMPLPAALQRIRRPPIYP